MIKIIKNFYLINKLTSNKKFFFALLLILLSSIFELFSIGMIIPLITSLSNPEYFTKFQNMLNFNFISNYINIFNFKFFLLGFFICVYYLKALLLVYVMRKQLNYCYDLGKKISIKLFYKYINIDYGKYVNLSNSDISRNILTEVSVFVSSFLIPFIFLISEIAILVLILILLLFYEYKITLILFFTCFIVIYFYYQFIKKNFSTWGLTKQINESKKLKIIQNVFFSLKDIKIFQNEEYYYNQFIKIEKDLLSVSIKQNLFLNLPRILIEIVAITSFSIIIFIVFSFKGDESKDIIPLLALYGLSCLRILPSFGKILSNLQNIKYSKSAVSLLANELEVLNKFNIKQTQTNKVKIPINRYIELNNIKFNYQGSNIPILINIDFKLNIGSKILITGKSGSGKTTLVDILLGIQKYSSGSIIIDGSRIRDEHSWISNFSYVSQKPFFFESTLAENIAFKKIYTEEEKKLLEKILKITELWDVYQKLDFKLNKELGDLGKKLSGGQYQRLAIARGLYRNSRILILDEATNALDIVTESKVVNNIFKEYKDYSIIIISHNSELSKFCDEAFLISDKYIKRIK
jgi:ABC-type multidrug transport system fused ATPase/permease subunit